MADEKDRLGKKLHDVEAAREDQWAAQQDAELMKRIREKLNKAVQCPDCHRNLVPHTLGDVPMLTCPDGDGAWIEGPALEKLAKSIK
jgi:hypothetical protein